jgi:hypothetical protein
MAIVRVGELFDTGAGHRHRIDAGRDGSLVVISTLDGGYLSRIDEDGSTVLLQAAPSNGNLRSGEIDTLSDGRYVVSVGGHAGFGSGALVQILDRDGSPATGLIDAMVDDAARYGPGFTVTGTNDGGFAFVWNDYSAGSQQYPATHANGAVANYSGVSDVRIRYFDANGNGALSTVADDDVESISGVAVSRRAADQYVNDTETLAGGQTVFAYMDHRVVGSPDGNGSHGEWEVSVQIASPGDVGEPIKVDLGPYNEQSGAGTSPYPQAIDPAAGVNLVAMPDGGFAVLWTENTYAAPSQGGGYTHNGWQTVIRYFDAAGNPLTAAITLVTRGLEHGNHSKYVWAEAMSDGRIAIGYNVGVSGANGNGTLDAFLGVVGPLGSSIEATRVNQTAAGNTQFYTISDLAVRSDDAIELVYQNALVGAGGNANHTLIERFAVGDAGEVVQNGSAGADTISGGGFQDVIFGLGGADRLAGGGGRDNLHGGDGNDGLRGGNHDDRLFGGAGNDLVEGGAGADLMNGGAGRDTLSYATSDAGVAVRLANGAVSGGHAAGDSFAGFEDISGSAFGDRLSGDGGVNALRGLGGNDILDGAAGNDTLDGGEGNDTARGGAGIDSLLGGDGNDRLEGGDDGDLLTGGAGIDTLAGGGGRDILYFDDGDASAVRTQADRVVGHSRADLDRINLSRIDADTTEGADGDQAFTWLGAGAFSGAAGELRYQAINGDAFLQGDTDGDGIANFFIRVEDFTTLMRGDLVV